jgi:hypothetical protein
MPLDRSGILHVYFRLVLAVRFQLDIGGGMILGAAIRREREK